jgi:hypothetical protein
VLWEVVSSYLRNKFFHTYNLVAGKFAVLALYLN